MKTPQEFHFKIWQGEDGWYLAECRIGDEGWTFVTQGRTEDEIFDQVADAFKTALEIKCSWYRRLIWKIFRV